MIWESWFCKSNRECTETYGGITGDTKANQELSPDSDATLKIKLI